MPASAHIYKTRAKMRQDVVYRIILSSLALTLQTGLKKVTQKNFNIVTCKDIKRHRAIEK